MNRPANLIVRLLGIFIGVLLVAMLTVPLLGPGWHWIYGNFIIYEGWRLPVPKGYYVLASQNGPTMWKLTFGIPLFSASYGHISLFTPRPPQQRFDHDRDFAKFQRGVEQEASQSGYRFKSERTISAGMNSAYCLEFARSVGEPRSLLRCAVENTAIVLFYEGDSKYIPDVLTTLQGMSLESTESPANHDYNGRKPA